MVCRLCGAANSPQQTSCGSCGSSLEHTPKVSGARKHAEGRSAWYVWLALCLFVGGGLGFLLVRLRTPAPISVDLYAIGVVLGAAAGAILGAAPGPVLRGLRRGYAELKGGLFDWLSVRRFSRLRKECEEALESGETGGDVCCRLAAILWLLGQRDRAEQVLQRALSSEEDHSVARHNYGVAQAAAGHHARALEEFARAKADLDRSPTVCWNMGLARWAMGQLPDAAQAFRNAVELDETHLHARNALALALARQGEVEAGISELEALRSRYGQHPDVMCNLGVIHQSRGALDVAEGHFTGALRSDPSHEAARYNRGICAMLEGRYQAAIEDLSAVSRAKPNHAWALIQSAISWYRLGRKQRALEAMREAVRRGPADFQVRYNSGTLLLREEMIERAVKEMERAYEINPEAIEVVINLGVAMYLRGHLRHALDHFRAAIRMSPQHALARYNSVVASSMLDRLDEAEGEVEELIRLYPNFPDAHNAVGVVRLLQNRLVEAAEQFRRVADMMPRSAVARCNLALTYYLEGDLSAAREQADYAVRIDPDLGPSRDVAGHIALELNEKEEAVSHFRSLVRLEPTNPDAHSNLGLAYYRDERLSEAIESYKRVLVFSPKSPEGHNDLGLAYAKDKLLEEAAKHLAQVIEWRPDSPVLHSNLGLVYYFKGDTEDAVHEWREVTRLSPRYARMREETRFSAYDDQEMYIRPVDRKARSAHLPLKTAAFRQGFQLSLDEKRYQLEIPWPDIAAASRWQERATAARRTARRP